jgi:hypothetical protein
MTPVGRRRLERREVAGFGRQNALAVRRDDIGNPVPPPDPVKILRFLTAKLVPVDDLYP